MSGGMTCPSGLAGPAPVRNATVSSGPVSSDDPSEPVPPEDTVSTVCSFVGESPSDVADTVCVGSASSNEMDVDVGGGASPGAGEVRPPYVQSGPRGIDGP